MIYKLYDVRKFKKNYARKDSIYSKVNKIKRVHRNEKDGLHSGYLCKLFHNLVQSKRQVYHSVGVSDFRISHLFHSCIDGLEIWKY